MKSCDLEGGWGGVWSGVELWRAELMLLIIVSPQTMLRKVAFRNDNANHAALQEGGETTMQEEL